MSAWRHGWGLDHVERCGPSPGFWSLSKEHWEAIASFQTDGLCLCVKFQKLTLDYSACKADK